jgi:hypothetical protein
MTWRSVGTTFVLIAAAVCLAYAALSHRWLVNDARELRFSLRALDSGGTAWTFHDLQRAAHGPNVISRWFAPAGLVAFGAMLVAAGALVGRMIPTLRGSTSSIASLLVAVVHAIALSTAVLGAAIFVACKPTGPAFGVGVGSGVWVFVAGGVLAVAGVISARRCVIRPMP